MATHLVQERVLGPVMEVRERIMVDKYTGFDSRQLLLGSSLRESPLHLNAQVRTV